MRGCVMTMDEMPFSPDDLLKDAGVQGLSLADAVGIKNCLLQIAREGHLGPGEVTPMAEDFAAAFRMLDDEVFTRSEIERLETEKLRSGQLTASEK